MSIALYIVTVPLLCAVMFSVPSVSAHDPRRIHALCGWLPGLVDGRIELDTLSAGGGCGCEGEDEEEEDSFCRVITPKPANR